MATPHILALHGFTGRGSDFAPLVNSISAEWLCPDLPGHGPEPQLDCSPEAAVAFIEQQCTTFGSNSPGSKKVLLGYSMGARAALLHATRNPAYWDAFILISPNPGIEDEAERERRRIADDQLARSIAEKGIPTFIEYWQETPLIRNQKNAPAELRRAMQESRREHTAQGLQNSLRQFGQGSVPNLWRTIETLKMPSLIITGSTDEKYTAIGNLIAAQCSDTTHKILEGLNHAPHLESPEVVAEAIQVFLRNTFAGQESG